MKKYPKKHQPKIGDKIVLEGIEYVISDLRTESRFEIELIVTLTDSDGNFKKCCGIETDTGTNYRDPNDLKYFSLNSVQSKIRNRYE